MSGVVPVVPRFRFNDANGNPLANGSVTVYLAGTTTLANTYQDKTLSTANTNPVNLDGNGECLFWVDGANEYKFLLTTGLNGTGSTVSGWPVDNIPANGLGAFLQAGTGAVSRSAQNKMREVVSVTDYGADNTGGSDSADAVQAAVTYIASLGGGTVFFPRGEYRLNAKQRTTIPSNNNAYDGHAVVVPNGIDISFVGEGKGCTTIKSYAYGGGRNDASWQVVSSLVFRGAGIFFKGGSSTANASTIYVKGLTFDGTCSYTGVKASPANTGTGDGWDITQKAIWLENNKYFGRMEVRDCDISNYRGELIYSGGSFQLAPIVIEDNDLHDTNGDGFSGSGWNLVRRNRFYNCAGQGIECDTSTPDFQTVYEENEIYSCLAGITLALYGTTSTARQIVRRNRIYTCDIGIQLLGTNKVVVEDNVLVDCSFNSSSNRAIVAQTFNSKTIGDITIQRNWIICHSRSMSGAAILISGTTPNTPKAIRVTENKIVRTQDAITGGFTIASGISWSTDAVAADRIEWGNEIDATFFYTTSSVASETLLSTTGATDVAKIRPATPGQYNVDIFVQVSTAITNLTLLVLFADSAGSTQTLTLESVSAKAVGVYSYRQTVYAYGASESQYIIVRATAGTANQIKVSACISRARVSG